MELKEILKICDKQGLEIRYTDDITGKEEFILISDPKVYERFFNNFYSVSTNYVVKGKNFKREVKNAGQSQEKKKTKKLNLGKEEKK